LPAISKDQALQYAELGAEPVRMRQGDHPVLPACFVYSPGQFALLVLHTAPFPPNAPMLGAVLPALGSWAWHDAGKGGAGGKFFTLLKIKCVHTRFWLASGAKPERQANTQNNVCTLPNVAGITGAA